MKLRTAQDIIEDQNLLDIEKTEALILAFNQALQTGTISEMITVLYAFASHVDSTLGRKYSGGFDVATKNKHRDFTMEDYGNILSEAMSLSVSDVTIQNPLQLNALGEAIMYLYQDASDEASSTHSHFVTLNKLKNGVQLFEKVLSSRGMEDGYPDDNEINEYKPALKIFCQYIISSQREYGIAINRLSDAISASHDSDITYSAANVLHTAQQTVIAHPDKIELVTKAVNAATAVVREPGEATIKHLQQEAGQLGKRSWGRMLAGTMVALAGVAFIAACTATALVSFGVLAPVSILGFVVGASLIAGGAAIAGGVAGIGVTAAGAGFFASGVKQGKETRQLRHDLKELAADAKSTLFI